MSVVGLPAVAPTATSRKALAAIKKQSFASQLPSSRGVDPTITTVAKKEVVEDEGMARPSKEIYDAEQLALKNVIDALMAKQVSRPSFLPLDTGSAFSSCTASASSMGCPALLEATNEDSHIL